MPSSCPCAAAEPDEDVIGVEGIVKLCGDLGIEPADIVMVGVIGAGHLTLSAFLPRSLKQMST